MPEYPCLLSWFKPMEVLRVAVLFMFVLLAMLIAFTMVHKWHLDRVSRRYERFKARYRTALDETLKNPAAVMGKPATGSEADAACDAIIEMLDEASPYTAERLRMQARQLGLDAWYKRLACSNSYVRRFNAVERLGCLALPEMKYFLLSLLGREKSRELAARIVLALTSVVDEEDDLSVISQVLKDPFFKSSKFNEHVYANVIRSLRRVGREEVLLDFLDSLKADAGVPVALKKDIVEACGSTQCYAARDVIISYYHRFRSIPEMRIVCIRALGRIGAPDLRDIVRECLADSDWRVRAVAAKNGYLCPFELVEDLAACLTDSNYHVRLNAAKSLSQMGTYGDEALSLLTLSGDRFARDIARYVRQEAEVRV